MTRPLTNPRRRAIPAQFQGLWIPIVALVAAFLLPACARMGPAKRDQNFVRLVDISGPRFTTRSLAAVDIENPNGSVRVSVQPGLRDAVVEARGVPGTDTFHPETPRVELDVSKQITRGRMQLKVRPRNLTDSEAPHVDLIVRLPSCGGIRIVNASGNVTAHGITGRATIESGTPDEPGGDINLRTDLALDGPVDIHTTSGDINVRTGPGTEGHFSLGTSGGELTADIRGSPVRNARADPQQWTAQVGDAEHDVTMRTASGSLTVRVGR